jgi:hypothetical protein
MKSNIYFWSYLAQFLIQAKVVEKIKTHVYVKQLFLENHVIYEIMYKSIVEMGRPQTTIWRKRIAFWITKATNTHSEYVIFVAFPL